jgi:NitT/TauT family transport system substrate-binding protein
MKATLARIREHLYFGVTLLAMAAGFSLLFMGCQGSSLKVKVAYIGLTCEPPIFVAYENGYFKEEGLDVDLEHTDWKGLQAGLSLGNFHANHTLLMYILKPIENNLDVYITGGIHTGCLRIQADPKSGVKTVADLKGKKIGIPTTLGSPPHLYATRMLAVHGLDPTNDVTWLTYPPETAELALAQGQVDAIASAEPIGTILSIKNQAHAITDQAVDEKYKDEYCCAVVVNGKFAREHKAEAAKVTRALLKGAKWVAANPTAAAKLAVEKGYLAASPEINAQAISKLDYTPGVAKCRSNLDQVATELKIAGFLDKKTNPLELARRAWLDLPGVTDEWIQGIKVAKVAGGGMPPPMSVAQLEAILAERPICCQRRQGGCCTTDESLFPLPGAWALVRPLRWNPNQLENGGASVVASSR